jgi:hypothetical protein
VFVATTYVAAGVYGVGTTPLLNDDDSVYVPESSKKELEKETETQVED